MLTRKGKSLSVQLILAVLLIITLACVFLPEQAARPSSAIAAAKLKLTENWYDYFNDNTDIEIMAAAAAAAQQQNQLEQFEVETQKQAREIRQLQQQLEKQRELVKDIKVINPAAGRNDRVKAAFVILARNSDIDGLRSAIRMLEDRFNRNFNYPYVFLNDAEFTEEFKVATQALSKAKMYYGKVEEEMWGYPEWIDQEKAAAVREDMKERKVIYGGSESYRHMCRFQSGFFFRHPLLDQFEYYWRVEPSVEFYCDIDYDVFQMMKDNDYKYGWTISLTDFKETIPTLWNATKGFMEKYPQYVNQDKEDSLINWLSDDGMETYNLCHFWSNFEIGSLDFLRSERYVKYFEHLDKLGGFFYERWGDAPVHSLAVAMMLKPSEVHFFNDIGYKHNPLMHCPVEPYFKNKCWCSGKQNFDWRTWSCATRYKKVDPNFVWSEEEYINKTEPYRLKSISELY